MVVYRINKTLKVVDLEVVFQIVEDLINEILDYIIIVQIKSNMVKVNNVVTIRDNLDFKKVELNYKKVD